MIEEAPNPVGHDWRNREHYSASTGTIAVDVCRRCGMTRRYGASLMLEYRWASDFTTIYWVNSEPPCRADEANAPKEAE